MLALRKVEASDYAAVLELAATLVGFEVDRRVSFETTLAKSDHDVIIAEMDGKVVGYAHLMVYPDLTHGALAGELLGLIVREDMRRQGIATALMREIIRLARIRGVGELHINTEVDNHAARALYVGLGAEVVGAQMEIDLGTVG
jgi:ribosomal protein S18 acetylase RimI-like enzyme